MDKDLFNQELELMDTCFRCIMESTARTIMENSKLEFNSQLESWETFSKRQQAKIDKNVRLLQARFVNGFEKLLTEASSMEPVRLPRKKQQEGQHGEH